MHLGLWFLLPLYSLLVGGNLQLIPGKDLSYSHVFSVEQGKQWSYGHFKS